MFKQRALSLLAVAAIAGCTSKENKSTDSAIATPAATAVPNVVNVTAKDFAFDAPDSIPAGVTTFRLTNQGPNIHHLQLLKFEEGKTLADFQAAMKVPGPPPKWVVAAGGPTPPPTGETATATLAIEPGNYAMVCFVDTPDHVPHIMKGMARALTVTAPAPNAATAPELNADVTMTLADYSFTASTPLTAGKHIIRVDNSATQPHEIAIFQLAPGKTLGDIAAWGKDFKGELPGKFVGGMAAIDPKRHGFVEVDLPAGDYALLCFVPDAKDGKPHLMHGMAQQIKVS